MKSEVRNMKDKKWIIQGMILGSVFFLAILIIKPVGVSTQFNVLSGIVHSTIDRDVITEDHGRESGYKSSNAYYDKSEGKLAKTIKNPINYDFVFVLAIPLGAYLAYLLNKKKKAISLNDAKKSDIDIKIDISNVKVEKPGFLKTYGISFIGGFIILFGARMADGCTSGHMMSGMMQGSVSGFIFAAAVFIVAIPTAIIRKRLSLRRVGV